MIIRDRRGHHAPCHGHVHHDRRGHHAISWS